MVTSTPKLENFFGGTTMGTHHYEASDRGGVMALSLDNSSMYYHGNSNIQDFLNNPQGNSRQIQHQDYSSFRETQLSEETNNLHHQLPTTISDNDISNMKTTWVSRDYTVDHSLDQKMNGCIGDNVGYGDLQSLTLSMSPGSQSSCITGGSHQISPAVTTECTAAAIETKKRGPEKADQQQPKQIIHRKSIDTFGQRTSQYRGVTRFDLFFFLQVLIF